MHFLKIIGIAILALSLAALVACYFILQGKAFLIIGILPVIGIVMGYSLIKEGNQQDKPRGTKAKASGWGGELFGDEPYHAADRHRDESNLGFDDR